MARSNNKYASLNFNDIYEKKLSSSDPNNNKQSLLPSNNKTIISNSRIHGNMLVLSRPTPKPISVPSPSSAPPTPTQQQQQQPQRPAAIGSSDSISLRPLGNTGSLPIPKEEVVHVSSLVSPKTNRFVPPHLRPGFGGKEVKPESPPGVRPVSRQGPCPGQGQGHFGVLSPSPHGVEEKARPKSGGGMRRGFEPSSDPVAFMNRPGSSGALPSSSGL